MTENERKIMAEENRLKVSDHLTTDPDHLRDSTELASLLGTTNREIRAMVRRERMEGIPIIGTERGYRLAVSLGEYQAYVSKRTKWLDGERKDITFSAVAVTTKGYFDSKSIV